MDYFYQTHSERIVDVLLKTNPLHIFDRLLEWLRISSHKLPALTLLGHIISKHPTWLYQLEKHPVFREIFKILKTERDVVPEMCALLCVITLLAKIPYLVKNHLDELFEVFSYLAAWNNHHKTSQSSGIIKGPSSGHLEHLQIGLYIYFQRLYGMFPCNFMEYLKREYTSSANTTAAKGAIFTHTILPLLETVRMHPKLITESLESEVSEKNWRYVAAHDVITQCSRLSVDSCDNHQSQANVHDQCGAGGGGSYQHHILEISHTNRYELTSFSGPDLPEVPSTITSTSSTVDNYWTPSQMTYLMSPLPSSLQQSAPSSVTSSGNLVQSSPANIQQKLPKNMQFVGGLGGTSPPEAAVEATPETTPMNDVRRSQNAFPPQNSSAVRAIGMSSLMSGGSGNSQPSSPLKKVNTFRYPPEQNTVEYAFTKMLKLQMEGNSSQSNTSMPSEPTSIPSSPLPIGLPQSTSGGGGSSSMSKVGLGDKRQEEAHHRKEPELAKFELSQSPCNVGGLHMPNSRSIQEFKEISVQRERRVTVVAEEEEQEAKNERYTGSAAENEENAANKKTISAQTEPSWNSSAAYDHMLVELSTEAKRGGEVCELKRTAADSPKEILVKIVETSIAKKNAQNAKDLEEYFRNHILLLSYQLNFERQEREMTAERNRRLFGCDKDYK